MRGASRGAYFEIVNKILYDAMEDQTATAKNLEAEAGEVFSLDYRRLPRLPTATGRESGIHHRCQVFAQRVTTLPSHIHSEVPHAAGKLSDVLQCSEFACLHRSYLIVNHVIQSLDRQAVGRKLSEFDDEAKYECLLADTTWKHANLVCRVRDCLPSVKSQSTMTLSAVACV